MVGQRAGGYEKSGLLVEDLVVMRGSDTVIDGLSFCIDVGESVGILGHSGEGKTTLMLALMGLIPKQSGIITFCGTALSTPADRIRSGISFAREGRGLFLDMTVRENIMLGAYRRGDGARAIERAEGLFPELVPLLRRTAGLLSGGEQQMVAISRALACEPRLLLLDEATMGLSPSMTDRVFSALERVRRDGVSILIAGQEQDRIRALCDRSFFIKERGRSFS